jgi:hypothetical protein
MIKDMDLSSPIQIWAAHQQNKGISQTIMVFTEQQREFDQTK